jgi:hypothetical protein
MNLKQFLSSSLSKRASLSLPLLAIPGGGLILLGVLVILLPNLFIALISGTLILLGSLFLLAAWKFRPRKPRIRVVEADESW